MAELTTEQKATNAETLEHIQHVRNLINVAVRELLKRAEDHDRSKLGDPEVSAYSEITPLLKGSTYGSYEYKGFLQKLGPALTHHYCHNRHHPEHFGSRGVDGMNLIDVLEMLLDWKAATMRHADGDLYRSLDINRERFGLSEQLVCILQNTIRDLQLVTIDQRGTAFARGHENCLLDGMENAPFSSIGGLEARSAMKAPSYIAEADAPAYLRGYAAAAREQYGADWRTCEFSWGPAIRIENGGER